MGPRWRAAGQPPWTKAGSHAHGRMEKGLTRGAVIKVRCLITGIIGQVPEIVVLTIGGIILVRTGKVRCYPLGWGPTGSTVSA